MQYEFTINDVEFKLLRDFIHHIFGIYFKDERQNFLQLKLYPRVVSLGLHSFREYYQLIKHTEQGRKEVPTMLSLITNNETYFMREFGQLELLRDKLLPELRTHKIATNDKTLTVLSAGCSTGEEAYSLAMLIHETASFFWDWQVNIIGLDISEKALDTALKGEYRKRSVRMIDRKYIDKFLSQNDSTFSVRNNIKEKVSFIHGNILDNAAWQQIPVADIIFCRNVLIYFSREQIKNAITIFNHHLHPDGYLLLGHSETLTGITNNFKAIRYPNCIVYKRNK